MKKLILLTLLITAGLYLVLSQINSYNKLDQISKQIINPCVFVGIAENYGGSGVIFAKNKLPYYGYEYYVLTARHIILHRFANIVIGVDGITGGVQLQQYELPIDIKIYNDKLEETHCIHADILAVGENNLDLALLKFVLDEDLPIAKLLSKEDFNQLRAGSKSYSVGCTLTKKPSLTSGIISKPSLDEYPIPIIVSDVKIAPGNSGGGLYIEFNDNFYLVGIGISAETHNGVWIPHIGLFIHIETILDFIKENNITY